MIQIIHGKSFYLLARQILIHYTLDTEFRLPMPEWRVFLSFKGIVKIAQLIIKASLNNLPFVLNLSKGVFRGFLN